MSYTPYITFPRWVKITKTYTDFSSAALSNTISIYTLPAKSVVHNVQVNPTVAFTGGIISAAALTIDLVTTGDLFASASIFTLPTRPLPTTRLPVAGLIGSTDTVFASLTSIGGFLSTLTAGSVDIYLLISTLG